ncbi:MAG TPA: 2-phosphosulfolactate phosphatase [Chthoniobacterales bacterium]|nr:2-phosphosulfolactate phosphatase [Chthoniobacterales bacterium]
MADELSEKEMIEVALSPVEISHLPEAELADTTVVVFDVLRATSSMITGLAHGVVSFLPVKTLEAARTGKAQRPDLLLAGERNGVPPSGFDLGNSPAEFKNVGGRQIILTTTNGTAALEKVRGAQMVLLGSLLNLAALAEFIQAGSPRDLLLVCAGTGDNFSLEDAIGAGALLANLKRTDYSDAASMVHALYNQVREDLESSLCNSQNGRALLAIGKGADVRECSRLSVYNAVGMMRDEAVVRA